ncbi:MAG: MarR family transcriptional regulator [Nocardioidaceae bacterium]
MERLDRDLREGHGLSLPEYEILVRLSEAPEHRLRMAELADSVKNSRSRITHAVTRLEKAGLVGRSQCTSDGRGVFAILTDHGYRPARGDRAGPRGQCAGDAHRRGLPR